MVKTVFSEVIRANPGLFTWHPMFMANVGEPFYEWDQRETYENAMQKIIQIITYSRIECNNLSRLPLISHVRLTTELRTLRYTL